MSKIRKMIMGATLSGVAVALAFSPAVSQETQKKDEANKDRLPMVVYDKNPYPSTYKPFPSVTTVIQNATVFTGTGEKLTGASVLMENGKIVAVGTEMDVPYGAKVIDGTGKWVTPGIIDVHSHLGVYASPGHRSLSDGNEATQPVTADVWAEHSVWPQDPGFARAIAGGVTSLQILPGSANLIGGRGVTLKNVPSRTREGMKFPDAPYGMKMACGENPKRVYGKKGGPSTRMANMAGYRKAWIKARDYKQKWEAYYRDYKAGKDVKAPTQDLELETLMGVLDGEILIHNHCYRADEMVSMVNMAKEFDYKISTFHHAVESYKIADILAKEGICSAMWSDWWGFKLEAFDGVDENIPMVAAAKACAVVHSDDANGIQRLNQEMAKAWADGKNVGLDFSKAEAIQWITLNAARSLGVDDKTGSLEKGKMADVVLWSGDPFSVYSLAEKVFIDGALMYDRSNPDTFWQSDFEVGYTKKGAHQ
ncbi:amidohydrolase [Paremcibacter congregatus]|uniref:amidohydrolase n=1 Tax=Paremcibacter congregatus TaxID=2043170 RepID=UPI0030EB5CD7|tara:strand:+ start:9321 stop:10760 length:1440 start_codon:yes stop_codon:yes gene_type:complete